MRKAEAEIGEQVEKNKNLEQYTSILKSKNE